MEHLRLGHQDHLVPAEAADLPGDSLHERLGAEHVPPYKRELIELLGRSDEVILPAEAYATTEQVGAPRAEVAMNDAFVMDARGGADEFDERLLGIRA